MNATVVERLEEAGAVLVAKLTMGALAWGDVSLIAVIPGGGLAGAVAHVCQQDRHRI